MDNKTIYNIGQTLTAQQDIEVERCLGTKDVWKRKMLLRKAQRFI